MYSRHIQLILSFILLLVLSGCNLIGGRSVQQITPTTQGAADSTPALGLPTITPAAGIPQVTISSPTPNQQFQQTQSVSVVSIAVDGQGITKIELFVDGESVGAAVNPQPQPNQPFLANQIWQPAQSGMHVIQVRAYNPNEINGESQQVFVEILADSQSADVAATGTISETTTSMLDSQATPAADGPYLDITSEIDALNVRSGPGTNYDRVGVLVPDDRAAILGQSDIGEGRWWQISFADAPDGAGWVIDNPEWVMAYNADSVPQVTAPPTPVPPTDTPPATTPTPESNFVFQVDRTTIKQGECATFSWWTNEVEEVYYQEVAVPPGTGEKQECPAADTIYRMEIVNADGSKESKEISIVISGCLDTGEFVSDVNFPDGSTVAPGEIFAKKWRIKNTGACTWDQQYGWQFESDAENRNNFGLDSFPFEGTVAPGQEMEIVQELSAPTAPGMYTGQWTLKGPNRDTGTVWVGVNLGVGGISDPSGCLDAGEFVEHVTYPDGSTVSVGDTFIKTWRIKNTGTCIWNSDYFWSFSSSAENSNSFGVQTFPLDNTVAPGQEVEITQDLVAPSTPGQYVGQWLLLKQGREVAPGWVTVNVIVE